MRGRLFVMVVILRDVIRYVRILADDYICPVYIFEHKKATYRRVTILKLVIALPSIQGDPSCTFSSTHEKRASFVWVTILATYEISRVIYSSYGPEKVFGEESSSLLTIFPNVQGGSIAPTMSLGWLLIHDCWDDSVILPRGSQRGMSLGLRPRPTG